MLLHLIGCTYLTLYNISFKVCELIERKITHHEILIHINILKSVSVLGEFSQFFNLNNMISTHAKEF